MLQSLYSKANFTTRKSAPRLKDEGAFEVKLDGLSCGIGNVIGSSALLLLRRLVFGLLVALTVLVLAWCLIVTLDGGLGALQAAMVAAFLVFLPPLAFDFWNGVLGFLCRRVRSNHRPISADALNVRSAVVVTLRNESPSGTFCLLRALVGELDATGDAEQLDFFVLSDSDCPGAIDAEEKLFAACRNELQRPERLNYRRRSANLGLKGGNVHDFCAREGLAYEFMIVLDSDSAMSGETVLRLLRTLQSNPRIGIVQSFAVGLPSRSFFARVFQFGHRHALRCELAGAAWWQGDCCDFWGHNAAIRIRPYAEHCRPPALPNGSPFGGPLVCVDQIEGALMRRAGFGVCCLVEEGGSFEGNPPTLLDFIARTRRWCQGNLQNLRLISLPGLPLVGRVRLAMTALRFLSAFALVTFVTLACIEESAAPAAVGIVCLLYACGALYFSSRLLGLADGLLRGLGREAGTAWMVLSGICEILFTITIAPVVLFATTEFIVGLCLGRGTGWYGQRRNAYRLPWFEVLAALWRPTLFGAILSGLFALADPAVTVWFLPFLAGLVLAIPVAMVTSSPVLGAWAWDRKFCPMAEEFDPPPILAATLFNSAAVCEDMAKP